MTTRNSVPNMGQDGRSSEAGSAYLATLLVLVVLTILGLSLAVITQTEVLIGGSEKQATRQLFSSGSGVELAAAYWMVRRDASAHQMNLAVRTENLFGGTTVFGDDICTTPYVQIASNVCDLCAMNQDSEFAAVQNGVTATALRRGGSALAARKTIGAVVTLEPFPKSAAGLQFGSGERLLTTEGLPGPVIDIDPTTEVDPCEGLFLKI